MGKKDKEALCKSTAASKKTHKCSKSTGHDVAAQEHFAFQREQAVDFYVSQCTVTSMERLCSYWSSAAITESVILLIIPLVFIRTLKSSQMQPFATNLAYFILPLYNSLEFEDLK